MSAPMDDATTGQLVLRVSKRLLSFLGWVLFWAVIAGFLVSYGYHKGRSDAWDGLLKQLRENSSHAEVAANANKVVKFMATYETGRAEAA